jgi:hypothetical protein
MAAGANPAEQMVSREIRGVLYIWFVLTIKDIFSGCIQTLRNWLKLDYSGQIGFPLVKPW